MRSQKGGGTQYDKEMEKETLNPPAFHVKIIERTQTAHIISKRTQTEAKAKQASEPVLQYTRLI